MLSEQKRELVMKHMGLVGYVLKKYVKINVQRWEYDYEDLYQVGYEGLCIAADEYKADRGASYWHYAERVVRNKLFDYCNAVNRVPAMEQLTEAWGESDYREQELVEKIILLSLPIDSYQGVTQKGLKALYLRYAGYSIKEIAQYYQVPVNHISAWISMARKALRQELMAI